MKSRFQAALRSDAFDCPSERCTQAVSCLQPSMGGILSGDADGRRLAPVAAHLWSNVSQTHPSPPPFLGGHLAIVQTSSSFLSRSSYRGGGGAYFTVSLKTSSRVVTPSRSFCRPDARRVIIPFSIAFFFSSNDDAPMRISSRKSSLISITS